MLFNGFTITILTMAAAIQGVLATPTADLTADNNLIISESWLRQWHACHLQQCT